MEYLEFFCARALLELGPLRINTNEKNVSAVYQV